MKSSRFLPIILIAGLFLGGCESLASFGGAIVSTIGSGAVNSLQSKIEARARWRAEDSRIRGLMVQTLVTIAMVQLGKGEVEKGLETFRMALDAHKAGQPLFLIQELREAK